MINMNYWISVDGNVKKFYITFVLLTVIQKHFDLIKTNYYFFEL